MKKNENVPHVGNSKSHLGNFVRIASFGGLFFSLLGTLLIWAGSDSFNLSPAVWKSSLGLNLIIFLASWLVYLPFRKSDSLLGHGIISMFVLFAFFWLFGFSMFYFYFIFAPLYWVARVVVLALVSFLLVCRVYVICGDIESAFANKGDLFERMYVAEDGAFRFTRESVGYLEKARPERSPFRSFHAYVAMAVAPFVLILNRLLAPITGDGHGVFLVLAFFSVPLMLWGAGIVVQTVVTMICIPLRIYRATGKIVLVRNW